MGHIAVQNIRRCRSLDGTINAEDIALGTLEGGYEAACVEFVKLLSRKYNGLTHHLPDDLKSIEYLADVIEETRRGLR